MISVGKAMARLNPKNVRFDVGSGGMPELTPEDVAGALAFVPAGLGRELLCRVWWPDGARLTGGALKAALTELLLVEWNARETAVFRAIAAIATQSSAAERKQAERLYAAAHAARWPAWVVKLEPLTVTAAYEHIVGAVLEELAHPKTCSHCEGRGFVVAAGAATSCRKCDGKGITVCGPTWRSKRLGMKESSFTQRWEAVYEWLYAKCQDEVQAAEQQMARALRG